MATRSSGHSFPAEENNAVRRFYGSDAKKCAVTGNSIAVWAHMLGASPTDKSSARLQKMLKRNLREERYSLHAAEVQENIIPLDPMLHIKMDSDPTGGTLFLHEDVVARTLAFEFEHQRWRLAELNAGRTDSGRLPYRMVFPSYETNITPHRWHCTDDLTARYTNRIFYPPEDCPSVYPSSTNPYPIVNTLLSIPFSLIHTLPRLSALSSTPYRMDLVCMAQKIESLWQWDPESDELRASEAIQAANDSVDETRTPPPPPINHMSRQNITFETMRPQLTFGTFTTRNVGSKDATTDSSIFQLDTGEVLFGKWPVIEWDAGVGLQHAAESGDVQELEGAPCKDEGIIAGVSDECFVLASEESSVSDDGKDLGDLDQRDTRMLRSSSDIMAWLDTIIDPEDEEKVPPLIPTPFQKGVIYGTTVKDKLMIKGLIPMHVYLKYFDLEPFSFP